MESLEHDLIMILNSRSLFKILDRMKEKSLCTRAENSVTWSSIELVIEFTWRSGIFIYSAQFEGHNWCLVVVTNTTECTLGSFFAWPFFLHSEKEREEISLMMSLPHHRECWYHPLFYLFYLGTTAERKWPNGRNRIRDGAGKGINKLSPFFPPFLVSIGLIQFA